MEPLLRVDGRFVISGCGLVLTPDLPLAAEPFWPFGERVTVVRPGGTEIETPAEFYATRYRLTDGSHRHAVSVILPEAGKDAVPVGSEVRVAPSTRDRLRSQPCASPEES
ncbi:MAG: hypothetical protein AAF845_19290 [Bacteroidota bacterium]